MAAYDDYSTDKAYSPTDVDTSKGLAIDTSFPKTDTYSAAPEIRGADDSSPDVDAAMGHHVKKVLRWWDLMALGIGMSLMLLLPVSGPLSRKALD